MSVTIPALIGAGGIAVGTVLSWLFGQASVYLATERERRARLRVVLGQLLEIRHRLLVQPKLADPVETIGKLLPSSFGAGFQTVSAQDRSVVEGMLAQLVPDTTDLQERYDKAVAALAEADPVLYYQLRNKQSVLRLGAVLQQFMRRAGGPPTAVAAMHQALAEELGADLDGAILDVGSGIGGVVTAFVRARRLRRVLKCNPASDEDVKKVLERLLARFIQLLGSGASKP